MWRFMLLTFAFLGVAFYELSGGGDYAPGDNSLQVRGLQEAVKPAEVRIAELDAAEPEATQSTDVTRAVAKLSDLQVEEDSRLQITLASIAASNEYDSTAALPDAGRVTPEPGAAEDTSAIQAAVEDAIEADVTPERDEPESVATGFVGEEVFSLETYVMRQNDGYTIPESRASEAVASTGTGTSTGTDDLRRVTGNMVNMRAGPGTEFQKVGKLGKDTTVAVLEEPGNGWVMLEVMETGEIGWMADWLITASN